MAAAANRANPSIEFIVKPKDDLFLHGLERTLPRVSKGEAYPCQMQKNQNFSCLFRHYAKHNGLKKEDLVFFFVDELLAEETPETVHLMPQDEIWVEHRVQPSSKIEVKPEVTTNIFAEQFRNLLEKSTHSDITFLVGESKEEFKAHKAILSARSSYFEAMFRPEGMSESSKSEIIIERHEKDTFSRMIEFIYTGEILDIGKCCSSDVIDLLEMSMEYLLDDLGIVSEKAASKLVTSENIGKLMLLCARYNLLVLRDVCKRFVAEHGPQLRQDADFCHELQQYPELGLLILDAMQDEEVNNTHTRAAKRRRVTETTDVVPGQGGGANTIGAANQE